MPTPARFTLPARRGGRAWPCLAIALFLLTALTSLSAWAGEEVTIDGVLHVKNGAEPPAGVKTISARELWRVGGEDDDVFFGSVAKILADDDGNIYILDTQMSQAQVYSANGEFLKSLSREGDGPGEVRRPSDMFFLPDGSLGLIQGFPGKVIKVDLDGIPAGSLSIGDFGVLSLGFSRGGNIVLVGFHMSFDADSGMMDQELFASRCDDTGAELHRYFSKNYAVNPAAFVLAEKGIDFVWYGRIELGPDGRIYAAPERNSYAIHVMTPDGALEKIIEREYKIWPRTERQKKAARANTEAIGHYYPYPLQDVTILDTEPDVTGILVREDGSLWVANSRDNSNLPEGVLMAYDVFDKAGHYRAIVHVECPGDAFRDAVYMPRQDRMVVVTASTDAWRSMQGVSAEGAEEEEIPPLEVICYALDGPTP